MRPAKATIARRKPLHFSETFLANSPNFVGNIPCCLKKLPSKTMPKPHPFQEVEADEHGFQPQMKTKLDRNWMCGWFPEGLSDPMPITWVLFLYLWVRLYLDLLSIQVIPICQARLRPPQWMMNFAPPGGSSQAWMEFMSPSSSREEAVTLPLHNGEVHSRHDRSNSYRSAPRNLHLVFEL